MAKGLRSKSQKRNRSALRKTVMIPIVNKRRTELAELQKRIIASNKGNSPGLDSLKKSLNQSQILNKSKKEEDNMEEDNDSTENKGMEESIGENVALFPSNNSSKISPKLRRPFIVHQNRKPVKVYKSNKELVWFQ